MLIVFRLCMYVAEEAGTLILTMMIYVKLISGSVSLIKHWNSPANNVLILDLITSGEFAEI